MGSTAGAKVTDRTHGQICLATGDQRRCQRTTIPGQHGSKAAADGVAHLDKRHCAAGCRLVGLTHPGSLAAKEFAVAELAPGGVTVLTGRGKSHLAGIDTVRHIAKIRLGRKGAADILGHTRQINSRGLDRIIVFLRTPAHIGHIELHLRRLAD